MKATIGWRKYLDHTDIHKDQKHAPGKYIDKLPQTRACVYSTQTNCYAEPWATQVCLIQQKLFSTVPVG